jgi:porphobilinogen synthase
MLFPATLPEKKTMDGREALNPHNLICRTIQQIKNAFPEIGIITDVALDPYTTHGHDGLFQNGKILNDETVEILCKQALLQAQAGADIIAPSDMMDGRIGKIRHILDHNGFTEIGILSYAAKYASCFYGPFRDAVGSSNVLKGDKKTYQMNPANSDEALREVAFDIQEGADMVLVKPGLLYLDVIRRIKDNFNIPLVAYQVSGEYVMLQAAAHNGWLDYEQTLFESLLAFRRAGCDAIVTYGAIDMAHLLKPNKPAYGSSA